MAVTRAVDRPAGAVAALDEAAQGHAGELALGVRLVQAGPERGALRGVLSHGQRVEELQAARLGEHAEETRCAVVRVVIRPLEQPRVAVEQVQVPVDHAVLPRGKYYLGVVRVSRRAWRRIARARRRACARPLWH